MRAVEEHNLVGSSARNGIVERGIQSAVCQVKVSKSALEVMWEVKTPIGHAAIPWMFEYAAVLLNRME